MTYALKTPLPRGFRAGLLAAIAIVGCLGLAGCASQPDRYYTLAAPVGTPATAPAGGTPMFIELAPLALPERLARPQMVVSQAGGTSAKVSAEVISRLLYDKKLLPEFEQFPIPWQQG